VDEGKPLKGTYTVAVTDEQLVGVAMHTENRIIYLQAPESAAALVRMAGGPTPNLVLSRRGCGTYWITDGQPAKRQGRFQTIK
jgi:hypothetical protein